LTFFDGIGETMSMTPPQTPNTPFTKTKLSTKKKTQTQAPKKKEPKLSQTEVQAN